MPLREFEGCRQRIWRAETHYRALADLWNSFIQDEPYSAIVHVKDDGRGSIWLEPTYQSLPPGLALEVGETLYQLRAALDSAVYGAAIIESGQPVPPNPRNLEFPVATIQDDFPNLCWKIQPLTGERRRIIESVQPYNTPNTLDPDLRVFNFNRAIGILNDWARKDRHRRLHIVGSWAHSGSAALRYPAGVRLSAMHNIANGLFLEYQSKVAVFRLEGYVPGMEIEANPDIAIEIAVDEEPPPCAINDTLGNRLLAMIRAAGFVVKSIEDSFMREGRVGPDPRQFFYP